MITFKQLIQETMENNLSESSEMNAKKSYNQIVSDNGSGMMKINATTYVEGDRSGLLFVGKFNNNHFEFEIRNGTRVNVNSIKREMLKQNPWMSKLPKLGDLVKNLSKDFNDHMDL